MERMKNGKMKKLKKKNEEMEKMSKGKNEKYGKIKKEKNGREPLTAIRNCGWLRYFWYPIGLSDLVNIPFLSG